MRLPRTNNRGMGSPRTSRRVLTLNVGSSSLKAALYDIHSSESLLMSAVADGIGTAAAALRITNAAAEAAFETKENLATQRDALAALFGYLNQHRWDQGLDIVGHRIVHGGPLYSEPALITEKMVHELTQLLPQDPEHLPNALNAIAFIAARYPTLQQAACFDTAFHRHLPRAARTFALPESFYKEGIRRYGFHGLSYEYALQALRELDAKRAAGRVIVAHLGSGASMAAIDAGRCIDTSMGFTPTSGLMMGTRAGDIDPDVILHLIGNKGMSVAQVSALLHEHSGLLGVSGISSDMRLLLERQASDPQAAAAIELFCYRAKKYLGAYAAALGGLDALVFTGGIGEHAASVRERICAGLGNLGIQVDSARNQANAAVISGDASPVKVRVIKTDEGLVIARYAATLCG